MRKQKQPQARVKSKVVNLSEVYSVAPITFDDIQVMINTLAAGSAIVAVFESIGVDAMQRFIDYLSGAVYALNGSVRQLSDKHFLFVPDNVTVVIPA